MGGLPVGTQEILVAEFCKRFIIINHFCKICIAVLCINKLVFVSRESLPPHSASSLVVVLVMTLFPSDATQLRSLMGQVEPRNSFIGWKLENMILILYSKM